MKIVTLYNHKGGVSKTTTTFNIATYLADHGKKVLMVDADPQCNLTEIALARTIASLDKAAEANGLADAGALPGTSVLDALNQRIKGDVAYIDIEKIEPCEIHENLDLLRGSVDLSSIEDDLAEAHVQRMSMRTNLMRTYVSIGDFLVRLADKKGYDYIFIDVGPSSGALTRAFFLACDAFFIPVAPDRFNVQAIGTLSKILSRWIREHQEVISKYQDLEMPIRAGRPAFLGAIVQAFKKYAGEAKPGFKLWMGRLPVEIENSLRPVLEIYSDGLYLPALSTRSVENSIAVEIPDFNQLAPLMQEVGKAVFNIDRLDTALITKSKKPWGGNNWSGAQRRMASYKLLFKWLAEALIAFDNGAKISPYPKPAIAKRKARRKPVKAVDAAQAAVNSEPKKSGKKTSASAGNKKPASKAVAVKPKGKVASTSVAKKKPLVAPKSTSKK
ncbi:chromosome partitioning protein [Pseudomonas aeruginosa]|uniref:ParA plasmid partitioning protein n=2 Tax=Pseudomonas aeruginosa group TaxID=136841 RepID=A6VCC1_PSEP7|nr:MULTISPECIES: AAA family ATPase [Pseudomonas aeruginosa group]ABR86783.1 ParA plasmid partitioning protein [Pseudomonas aeruginosa PA7]MCW8362766.1 AAA family ATPase [Pseudomonas aeruginosa]MCW8368995.1 AAA family ATPase [Pseudomonas aeruginosa]MCX3378767.1 AAA family ATPase [Pseudomonas aeruginosa]NQB01127.1 AAA family ATPase [Pseudomonas paraeruginosa]